MEDIILQSLLEQLPCQLLDDLLYCRRAMYDFLNVHMMLSPCLSNSLEGNGAFKLVVFLETLENEMRAIEKEQSLLTDEVKVNLTQLLEQRELLCDAATMLEYVSLIMNKHSDLSDNRVIKPSVHVTVRCTTSELLENYKIFTEGVPTAYDTMILSSSTSSIEWLDNDSNEVSIDKLKVFKDGYENHPDSKSSATTSSKRRRKIKTNADISTQLTPTVITISSPETSPELLSDNRACQESEDRLKQMVFLKNFNLVTHEETNSLKKRRSKRMRVQADRKDYTNERKKRVSNGSVERTSNSNGQKRPRGRPRSVGVQISG